MLHQIYGEFPARVDEMLAIVQNEEMGAGAEVLDECLIRRVIGLFGNVNQPPNVRWDGVLFNV